MMESGSPCLGVLLGGRKQHGETRPCCGWHLTGATGVPWKSWEVGGLPGGEDITSRARRALHGRSVEEGIQAEDTGNAKVWGLE